jgi:hypothetical protein
MLGCAGATFIELSPRSLYLSIAINSTLQYILYIFTEKCLFSGRKGTLMIMYLYTVRIAKGILS